MFNRTRNYLANVLQELKKVSWPSREELIGSTYVVIIISGILAIYIFTLDTILSNILKLLLK